MFNFFRKKRENVHEKLFLFILATAVVTIGIGNELFKGTSATELPVNESFDDMSFYMCVVDSYNRENETDYQYTYNMTDEELASIAYLNCSIIGNELDEVEKIKSTKGVEKLVSLVEIHLFEHDIASIDLSENVKLEKIQLRENRLTNIDVSNNVNLQVLDVSYNQLTDIDVSSNINLLELYVNNNNLSELDLTNNNKLEIVFSLYNRFSKTLNIYNGDTITLESIKNIIKLPSMMSQDLFYWLALDNMVSVDENDVVTALNGGVVEIIGGIDHEDFTNMEEDISYYLIDNMINVIDISSDEYVISEEENFIYTGNKNLDVNKVDVVEFNLNVDRNKLQILNEEKILVTELDILGISFGELNVSSKVIRLVGEISYNDFISNITKSDVLNYKILKNNEEVVESGNMFNGEKIEIYYDNILLDRYEINIISQTINDIIFDDSIVLDRDNNYIKY